MTATLGALVFMLAAGGIWVAVRGWVGVPVSPEANTSRVRFSPDRDELIVIAVAIATGLGFWAITGWPVAGVSIGATVFMVPQFFAAQRERAAYLARAEALAAWAEMLRDTMATHAGLQQAIAISAAVAPGPIRANVRRLATRSSQVSLQASLREFAVELADPVADKIVAAVMIADAHQARDLPVLLGEIASSTRQQAAMRSRVETSRAKTYASSRSMVIITGVMMVLLMVLSPDFMRPYDSFAGQLVLGVSGGLFAGAVWALIALSRPTIEPRVLAGIEGSSSSAAVVPSAQDWADAARTTEAGVTR